MRPNQLIHLFFLDVEPGVDEKGGARMLEQSTEQTNYSCAFTVVPNAFIGLECSEYTCYDLIIAKRDMQHLAAVDMLKVLRAVGSTTPMVLLLDEVDTTHDLAAESSGFFSVLRKPLSTRVLCSLIETIMNGENNSLISPATVGSQPENQHYSGDSLSNVSIGSQSQSPSNVAKLYSPSTERISHSKIMCGVFSGTGVSKGPVPKSTKINSEKNNVGSFPRKRLSGSNEESNEYHHSDGINTRAASMNNNKTFSKNDDTPKRNSPSIDSTSNLTKTTNKSSTSTNLKPTLSNESVSNNNSNTSSNFFEAELLQIEGIKASRCARIESQIQGLDLHSGVFQNSLTQNNSVSTGAWAWTRAVPNVPVTITEFPSVRNEGNEFNAYHQNQNQYQNNSSQYKMNGTNIQEQNTKLQQGREEMSHQEAQNDFHRIRPKKSLKNLKEICSIDVSEAEHSPLTEDSYAKLNQKNKILGNGSANNREFSTKSPPPLKSDRISPFNSTVVASSNSPDCMCTNIHSKQNHRQRQGQDQEQEVRLDLNSDGGKGVNSSIVSGISGPGSGIYRSGSGFEISESTAGTVMINDNLHQKANSCSDSHINGSSSSVSMNMNLNMSESQVQGRSNVSIDQNINQHSKNQQKKKTKVNGAWDRDKAAKQLVKEWAAEKGISSIYPNLSSLNKALPYVDDNEKDNIRFTNAIATYITSQNDESRTHLLAEVAFCHSMDRNITRNTSHPSSKQSLSQSLSHSPRGASESSNKKSQSRSPQGLSESQSPKGLSESQSIKGLSEVSTNSFVGGIGMPSSTSTSTSNSAFSCEIPSLLTHAYLASHDKTQAPHITAHTNIQSQYFGQTQAQIQSQIYNQIYNDLTNDLKFNNESNNLKKTEIEKNDRNYDDNDNNNDNNNNNNNDRMINVSKLLSSSSDNSSESAFTSLLFATGSTFKKASNKISSRKSILNKKMNRNDATKNMIQNEINQDNLNNDSNNNGNCNDNDNSKIDNDNDITDKNKNKNHNCF